MMCDRVQKEQQEDNEDRTPIWSSYKLIADPVLESGTEKLYRYDGVHFSSPNGGVIPPEVKDPRFTRTWIKFKESDLPVPKFKTDEHYVGPPREVTFARLNDNIKAAFLRDMCTKFGEVQHLEVLYNPVNKKHLGIAKVVFESVRAANEAVQKLHNTSVMGITIHVELDPKGEKRLRYFQLLVSGLYTPFALPLGGDAWRPQSPSCISDPLNEDEPVKPPSSLSSTSFLFGSTPFDVSTPMSMDTAYSSMHQDTPSSFWQDTPHSSPVSHVSHSDPGTPPRETPESRSEPQPPYRDPHPVPLTPHAPDTKPGARQAGRTPGGRHRGRAWGAKYQNAYNRRPEHRYVHRPGFNSNHYGSGTNLAPLGPAAAHVQMDKSSRNATDGMGQNVTPFVIKDVKTSRHPSGGVKVREPITPVSPRVGTHQDQPRRNMSDNPVHITPSRTSHNSPPRVPGDAPVTQTPKLRSSPRPEKSPSIASPSSDPVPSSLDSRIKMLLGSPDPSQHGENSDSEGRASPDALLPSQPLGVDGSASLNRTSGQFSGAPYQRASTGPGIEDVNPAPLPDSAGEKGESETCPSRIPVILNVCSTTRSGHPSHHAPQPFLPGNEAPDHRTGPGTREESTSSARPIFQMPPPPVLLPPPGFVPRNLPLCEPPPPSSPNLPAPPSLFYLFPVTRPAQFPSAPAPLPIPTRITQGKSQPVYPAPFPTLPPPTPLPYQAVGVVRQRACLAAPSWPPHPMPAVPLPGDVPVRESLHGVTVDGVMAAVAAELKAIVKRDIRRRMIEVIAFGAFDHWWNENERTAKISTGHPQPEDSKEKERVKPRDLDRWNTAESLGVDGMTLGARGLRSALKLPSFNKVKRKDPSGEDPVKTKRSCPSSPGQSLCAGAEADQQTRTAGEEWNEPETDHQVVRRRHARPLELDSDEEEEEESSGKNGNEDMRENELPDTEEDEENREDTGDRDEDWTSADKPGHSDEEVISTALPEPSSSFEVDSSSSASPMSVTSSSYGRRYSSESDAGDEGEPLSSKDAGGRPAPEEIWISSDEEGGDEQDARSPAGSSASSWGEELEPPPTPSAPSFNLDEDLLGLPRGQEEELRVQVFLHSYGCQDAVKQHLCDKLDLTDPALLSSVRELDLLYPPSPSFRASSSDQGLETPELEDPAYLPEILEDSGNLRPPTPTGSLSDSDPEIDLGPGLSFPASEEEERPPTPGGAFETELETPVLSPAHPSPLHPPPSPTGARSFPSPLLDVSSPLLPSCPAYDDPPRTPGRNKEVYHPVGVRSSLRTAMHGTFLPSFLSVSPHAGSGIPRTPGRDAHPMSPLSDESEASFDRRESVRQRGRWQRHPHPTRVHSGSSSPRPSDSSGSVRSDVLQLRKKRERLLYRRRIMLMHRHKQTADALPRVTQTGDVQQTNARVKKPLQGLENHLGNHQNRDGHRKAPDAWRERRSCPRRFNPRSRRRERLLIDSVWTKGVNTEEIGLLKTTYERMLQQDDAHDWLRSTHWVPHPPSSVPVEWPMKPTCVRYHLTGCARTEGYYIISKRDKFQYIRDGHAVSEENVTNTRTQLASSSRSGSDFRAEQRRLLSSFSCDSDLLKFNQLKYRKKKLRFSWSRIHEWGLFAEEPIAADEMVIEYVGESIRQVIADMRERRYEQEGIGSSYLFRVDLDTIIDATKCGNLARFINHSCNPNCYAKVITVESKKKIVIYSRKQIGVNEEITYDYKFPIEDEKIPCLCGAENCRGTLN